VSLQTLLTHRVTVQSEVVTRDSDGGVITTYSDKATDIACQIHELSAAERLRHAQLSTAVSHEIITRYASVEKADRILLPEGTYVRVQGVQTVRSQGTIPTHYVILGEEVK
jgi:SPP1 family predicted phage head-tail adaptor